MNYPTPQDNSLCQCKDNPMKAFWCQTGHMMECHYPLPCQAAACSHLRRYDFHEEDIQNFEGNVREGSEMGLVPYTFDEHGNATVVDFGKRIANAIRETQESREGSRRTEDANTEGGTE